MARRLRWRTAPVLLVAPRPRPTARRALTAARPVQTSRHRTCADRDPAFVRDQFGHWQTKSWISISSRAARRRSRPQRVYARSARPLRRGRERERAVRAGRTVALPRRCEIRQSLGLRDERRELVIRASSGSTEASTSLSMAMRYHAAAGVATSRAARTPRAPAPRNRIRDTALGSRCQKHRVPSRVASPSRSIVATTEPPPTARRGCRSAAERTVWRRPSPGRRR